MVTIIISSNSNSECLLQEMFSFFWCGCIAEIRPNEAFKTILYTHSHTHVHTLTYTQAGHWAELCMNLLTQTEVRNETAGIKKSILEEGVYRKKDNHKWCCWQLLHFESTLYRTSVVVSHVRMRAPAHDTMTLENRDTYPWAETFTQVCPFSAALFLQLCIYMVEWIWLYVVMIYIVMYICFDKNKCSFTNIQHGRGFYINPWPWLRNNP